MALIKCKECGKEISNKAKKCSYCGAPIKNKILSIIKVITLIITIFIFVLCIGGFIIAITTYPNNNTTNNNTTTNNITENKKNTKKEDTQGLPKSAYTTLKDTIKDFKNSSYDPDSFKLYEISVFYYNEKYLQEGSFDVIVTYSGTNAYGATVRNYYYLTFIENNISPLESHNYKAGQYDEAEKRAKEHNNKNKIKLDLDEFNQYIVDN